MGVHLSGLVPGILGSRRLGSWNGGAGGGSPRSPPGGRDRSSSARSQLAGAAIGGWPVGASALGL